MARDTNTMFAAVIEDFNKWYETVAPSMNDEERAACQNIIQNIHMPRSAWKKPHKHPLYAAAIENNGQDLTFAAFYCLRLVYVDHYQTLRNVARQHPNTEPCQVRPEKVRNRFMKGTLVELASAHFGNDILFKSPKELPELYLHGQHKKAGHHTSFEPEEAGHKRGQVFVSRDITPGDQDSPRRSRRKASQTVKYYGMDPSIGDDIYADLNTEYEKTEAKSFGPDTLFDTRKLQGVASCDKNISFVQPSDKKVEQPFKVGFRGGGCQGNQGFGMTISDAELVDHVQKELQQCGTWGQLKQSMHPLDPTLGGEQPESRMEIDLTKE